MGVQLLTDPAGIPTGEWDRLYATACCDPIAPELGRNWLSFLADARAHVDERACPPVTLVAAPQGPRTTAMLVFVEEDRLHVSLGEGQGNWRAGAALGREVRGIHCRVPLSHTLAVLHEAGPQGLAGLGEIVAALENRAVGRGMDFVQVSRVQPGTPLQALLARRGYEPYPNFPDHVMEIRWTSLAEYAMWLPRQMRHNLRREMRRFDDRGFDMTVLHECTDALPQLYALYEGVCRRHGSSPSERMEFFARAMASLAGFGAIVARYGGTPVGCLFLYGAHGILSVKNAGLNYAASRHGFVYTNLLYRTVQHAIEQRFKRVHFGLTNTGLKGRLGAPPLLSERRILPLAGDLARVLGELRARSLWSA